MKFSFITMALFFSLSNAFAQSAIEATSATTLSPFATATRMLESGTITTLAPFASTIAVAQERGVAGKEQLKDELAALNDDMASGAVKTIDQVKQPALKELFMEISEDKEQMNNIGSVIKSGSKLHKIATALNISLLAE
jgi:hypothetical protein